MIPKSKWVWYGYAGHLCVSKRCAYHLCTRIGNRLVSTVGEYYPPGSDKVYQIGAGKDDYFETMVFEYKGEDKAGNPTVTSYQELECIRYSNSIDTEKGHRDMCKQVAKREQ